MTSLSTDMRPFISILLFFWATKVSSQSLCETKTPQLIYNKISSSYKIQDDIKPYRIDWYSHDTIIKTAMSHRTAPEQLISVPNFRHFKVCPHIQRNGDIYFLGDSFWHYSVFKVNFQTKTYDRQFNLSEHFTINRSFLDSFLAGMTIYGSIYLEDSCHDLSNCFVMDNDGMMYIDKVHIQNFIAFDPISKTYKLIDRFQEPVYGLMNFTEHNLLYIYYDKSLFKSIEMPAPFNRYIRYSGPQFLKDSLFRMRPVFPSQHSQLTSAGLYRNRRFFATTFPSAYSLNANFDAAFNYFTIPIQYQSSRKSSLIDGQGTIYLTKKLSGQLMSEISNDYVHLYNLYSAENDSVKMPKDSLLLAMNHSTVRLDCSGSLYAFGYLYRDAIDHKTNGRHTLNLYKQTAYIDSGINHSFDSTLRAIVYYYDADSVILDSKQPRLSLDTGICAPVIIRGKRYDSSGSYIDTLYNSTTGIDTILSITITRNKTYSDTFQITKCDSFAYNDNTYRNSGKYTFKYSSAYSCDSNNTLDLKIYPSKFTQIRQFSCSPIQWMNSTYGKTGIYSRILKTVNQCDSILTLNLTIGLNRNVSIDQGINYKSLQDSVTYQWYRCYPWRKISNEQSQRFTTTTPGSYAVTLDNGKGCKDTSDCIALGSSSIVHGTSFLTTSVTNPFTDELWIVFIDKNKTYQLNIYDISGRRILTQISKNEGFLQLPTVDYASGIYILEIVGESETERFKIRKD